MESEVTKQRLTDQEIEDILDGMEEYFGIRLPNPEQNPKQFAFCCKLFKYYKSRGDI